MEDVSLKDAKERLEELVEKAARGEVVRIVDPRLGEVQLTPVRKPNEFGPRVTDSMPPFVPLKEPRVPGRLAGTLPPPPDDFFDPLTEEELKDWYGDDPA